MATGKRKAAEDGEKKEAASARTSSELKKFASAAEGDVLRTKTFTTSFERVVQRSGEEVTPEQLQGRLLSASNALGILKHLATVYLNQKAVLDPTCEYLLDRTMYQQLLARLACQPQGRLSRPLEDPFLDEYVQQHPLSLETKNELADGFCKRARDALCGEMITAARRHVSDNFPERFKEHVACDLERRLWELREDEHFEKFLEYGAHAIFVASTMNEDADAVQKIEEFLIRRGEGLDHTYVQAAFEAMDKYRNDIAPLRGPIPPPKEGKKPRTTTQVQRFYYHVKNAALVLPILARYREEDKSFVTRRGEIWEAVNAQQPALRPATTKEGVRQQAGGFTAAVPAPPWIQEEGELNEQQANEYGRLITAAARERWRLFRVLAVPGTLHPPKRFTIMPVSPLKPAFVTVDADVVSWIGSSLGKRFSSGRKERLWWKPVFDFHRKGPDEVPSKERRSLEGRRGVLKTGKRVKQGSSVLRGIPALYGQQWVLNEDEYLKKQTDPDVPVPWLINNIKTDGCRVQVTLVSLRKEGAAIGSAELAKAGYLHIDQKYIVGQHQRGIFATAEPVTPELLEALDETDSTCFLDVVGVDPGGKCLITSTSAKLTSGITPESFKLSGKATKASDYRYASLAKRAQNFEKERREANAAYGLLCSSFATTGATLKTAQGTAAYVDAMYQSLDTSRNELLSWERRQFAFARQRARDRAIASMVRQLCGANPEAAAKRTSTEVPGHRHELQKRVKFMLDASNGLRTWTRVVFFGNAQFGHGSSGPLPRKALLKALSSRCVVVLTDEFRTSKCCCGCGSELVQQDGSRVYGCQAGTDEGHCSVRFIDRDINASVNIAMCGVSMLLGRSRPVHLQRPVPAVEVDGMVEE